MHLQHGQACNNEKQDDGCGGSAAIVEILVKGIIDENPLCGGCSAGASGSVHIGSVQQLHGGDYAHDQLDKNHEGNVGQDDPEYFTEARAAVQGRGFHNIGGNSLYGGQIQKNGKTASQNAGEDNTEFNQAGIAQPGPGLPSEKFDDFISNAVVRMPDPLPYNDVYGGGNEGRKDVKGGKAFLEADQLV